MTNDNTHIWHLSADRVARYTDGSLPEPDAWSLEKHVEGCGGCAARVSEAVRGTAAGAVLAEIRASVLETVLGTAVENGREQGPVGNGREQGPVGNGREQGPVGNGREQGPVGNGREQGPVGNGREQGPVGNGREQGPVGNGREQTPAHSPVHLSAPAGREHSPVRQAPPAVSRLARLLWAAGPAVRGAWLPAVLVVAAGALALAYGAGFPAARALLLAVAPVVPVAGIALSYGPHADPLHEIAAATPGGGLRLALTRTVAVLAVSVPLLTFTGLLLPASGAPAAAAWLLPGLALALGSLALASFVGCRAAALVTGGGWLAAVLGPVSAGPGEETGARLAEQLSRCLDGFGAQGAWAAAAALSAVLLAARRPAYDRPLGR